ncbi:GGDEF domain-containing protein [Piscinibacter aquaticus]|uniref:diguanylate cyclase n=1 Tax=Piscinibacter aquaticus TaxID=392597 RepID=A0A5C6TZF7_9BURK|nr:GGDEF domain-containing protein [Piscinibacter aquaticus]
MIRLPIPALLLALALVPAAGTFAATLRPERLLAVDERIADDPRAAIVVAREQLAAASGPEQRFWSQLGLARALNMLERPADAGRTLAEAAAALDGWPQATLTHRALARPGAPAELLDGRRAAACPRAHDAAAAADRPARRRAAELRGRADRPVDADRRRQPRRGGSRPRRWSVADASSASARSRPAPCSRWAPLPAAAARAPRPTPTCISSAPCARWESSRRAWCAASCCGARQCLARGQALGGGGTAVCRRPRAVGRARRRSGHRRGQHRPGRCADPARPAGRRTAAAGRGSPSARGFGRRLPALVGGRVHHHRTGAPGPARSAGRDPACAALGHSLAAGGLRAKLARAMAAGYASLGRFADAYAQTQRAEKFQDEGRSFAADVQMLRLEARYAAAQRDAENAELRHRSESARLALEAETVKQRALWAALATLGLLTAALLAFGWRALARRRSLADLALRDELTGAPNRRAVTAYAQAQFDQAQRLGVPLTLALIDLDHFKRVNDTFGHAGGDAVLRALADAAQGVLRGQDRLGRWGGEEWLLVMPGTAAAEVPAVFDRLRSRFAATPADGIDGEHGCSFSMGAAALTPGIGSLDSLIAECDRQLYRAKQEGRDRLCFAG